MSGTACMLVSLGVVAIGVAALVVGMRGDTMTAKVGGAVITVIGVLGVIACTTTG